MVVFHRIENPVDSHLTADWDGLWRGIGSINNVLTLSTQIFWPWNQINARFTNSLYTVCAGYFLFTLQDWIRGFQSHTLRTLRTLLIFILTQSTSHTLQYECRLNVCRDELANHQPEDSDEQLAIHRYV